MDRLSLTTYKILNRVDKQFEEYKGLGFFGWLNKGVEIGYGEGPSIWSYKDIYEKGASDEVAAAIAGSQSAIFGRAAGAAMLIPRAAIGATAGFLADYQRRTSSLRGEEWLDAKGVEAIQGTVQVFDNLMAHLMASGVPFVGMMVPSKPRPMTPMEMVHGRRSNSVQIDNFLDSMRVQQRMEAIREMTRAVEAGQVATGRKPGQLLLPSREASRRDGSGPNSQTGIGCVY